MRNDLLGPSDLDYLSRKERTKDLLREAERVRQLQSTKKEGRLGKWLRRFSTNNDDNNRTTTT